MKKRKKLAIFLIVMDVFVVIGFFITYGPFSYVRDLVVTTSMTTMTHKYIARTFYTEEMIDKILSNNYVKENYEDTNTSDITIGTGKEADSYDSIYDEQILKRDPDHKDYKVIPISGTGYKGYIGVVYDPARVTLGMTPNLGNRGAFLRDIVTDNQAILGMNASGFLDPNEYGNGGAPTGIIIKDSKLIWTDRSTGTAGGIAGFNKNNILVLTKSTPEEAIQNGMRDAVEFGPFLMVNGKAADIRGNGGWGVAPRSVLAQRKDGIVLFIVIDGRQPGYSLGASMEEMIEILTRYKAHNAVNLDGGASSSLVENGNTVSKPCGYSTNGERLVPNGWIMK